MKTPKVFSIQVTLVTIFVSSLACSEYDKEWKYKGDSQLSFLTAPSIGHDGTVYINEGSALVAIAPDGEVQWKYDCYAGAVPTIGPDSAIYVGSHVDGMLALTPSGEEKWRFQTWGSRVTSPAIDDDGNLYFMSGYDSLYSIDSAGQFRWGFKYEYVPYSDPSSPVISEDGTIYARGDSYLYSFNPDGTLNWSCDCGAGNLALDSEGNVYFTAYKGGYSLKCLYPDGTEKWKYLPDDELGRISVTGSPAIGHDGTIYILGWDDKNNHLFAIDKEGNFKWKCKVKTFSLDEWGVVYGLGSTPDPTPTIDSDGTIYLAYDDKLFAITPEGDVDWKFDVDGIAHPPAIDVDGTLYVCGATKLFALLTNSYGLASSPWPKQGGGNQNTGRARH